MFDVRIFPNYAPRAKLSVHRSLLPTPSSTLSAPRSMLYIKCAIADAGQTLIFGEKGAYRGQWA